MGNPDSHARLTPFPVEPRDVAAGRRDRRKRQVRMSDVNARCRRSGSPAAPRGTSSPCPRRRMAATMLMTPGRHRARADVAGPRGPQTHAYSWVEVDRAGRREWVRASPARSSGGEALRAPMVGVGCHTAEEARRSGWEQLVTAAGVARGVRRRLPGVESLALAPGTGDRLLWRVARGDTRLRRGRGVWEPGTRVRTWEDGGRRFAIERQRRVAPGAPRPRRRPVDTDVVWVGTRTVGLWRERTDGAPDVEWWESVGSLPAAIHPHTNRSAQTPQAIAFVVPRAGPPGRGPPRSHGWASRGSA
jgi:hypothetical protein